MSASNMRSYRGFTLIELLIVIVIMALSTGIVAPNLYRQYQKNDSAIGVIDSRSSTSYVRPKGVLSASLYNSFL
ncbi:type II secretion system protein [Vibrio parahaemolyticus]|nr:type II secretion system protein [Vibrio parahaemolyticus]